MTKILEGTSCRSCKGPLEIIDENPKEVKVACCHCGDVYRIPKPQKTVGDVLDGKLDNNETYEGPPLPGNLGREI